MLASETLQLLQGQMAHTGDAPVTAFHAMLYPGVYPSDSPTLDHILAHGTAPSEFTESPYLDLLRFFQTARDTGRLAIQRLWMMPDYEQPTYDPRLLTAGIIMQKVLVAAGEDLRTLEYSDDLEREMKNWCGSENPLVANYLQAMEDREPKSSFWAFYKGTRLDPTTIGVMDYEGREYPRVTVYTRPAIPERVSAFARFWRRHFDQADPVEVNGFGS